MIYAQATKKGTGVSIFGDELDLRNLHETIHFLVNDAPLMEEQKEGLLNLAYELRHAAQGDREIEKVGYEKDNKNIYYGTKLVWPQILYEVAIL